MSEAMTQEDAMKMDNRQAVELLKPLRDMMIDQNGCPVSSAVFALDKAIEALTADVRENVKGEWVFEDEYYQDDGTHVFVGYPHCSVCNYEPYYPDDERINECTPFCPNCGADMRGTNHDRQD